MKLSHSGALFFECQERACNVNWTHPGFKHYTHSLDISFAKSDVVRVAKASGEYLGIPSFEFDF